MRESKERRLDLTRVCAIALLSAGFLLWNISLSEAATFTVSNSNDSGAESLRQAITDSNAAGGTNTIEFTVAVADTITLLSPLPTITGSTTYINTSGATGTVTVEGDTMDFSCTYLKLRGGDAMTIGTGVDMSGTTTITMGFEVDETSLNVTDGATLGCSTIYVAGDWDDGGVGTLIIENGGMFTNTSYAYIGYYYGATGEVVVDGAGSTWTDAFNNVGCIGRWGNGTLTIRNGGTITSGSYWITGWKSVGVGTVHVSGEGSKYIIDNRNLYAGYGGVGTITVADGGEIDLGTIGELRIAWLAGSTGTLNIGEGGAAGTITALEVTGNAGGGIATVNFNHNETSYIFTPTLDGPLTINHIGTGTTILTGNTTYNGTTTISDGTLNINQSRTLTGDVILNGTGTLDLAAGTLTHTGTYTQNANTTLMLTANSASTFGNIVSTGNAVVDDASTVAVTIGGYIPNNTILTVIDGSGGAGVEVPATITSSNQYVTFSGVSQDGDLILTASRGANGFGKQGSSANSQAAGNVLDNIDNPQGDMLTVLNTLEGASSSQVSKSLDTFTPVVNNSIPQVAVLTQNQFVNTAMDHLTTAVGSQTGVSTGSDMLKDVDVWAQGFGSYLHQDPQGLSNGYNATVWGSILGFEVPVMEYIRTGFAGCFAQDFIRGKDNSNRTDVDSYQGMLYGTYANESLYMNTAFSFAYNTYDASRKLTVVNTERTAGSEYNGQQYSGYVEGGYKLKPFKELEVTPLTSFQYSHLHLSGYTENGADA